MTKKVITIRGDEFNTDYLSVQKLLEKIENKIEVLEGQGCKRDEILTETDSCPIGYMYLHSERLETDKEYQERLVKEEATEAFNQLREQEKDKQNLEKLEEELVALQGRVDKAKAKG